jgi:hypothetical protein
MADNHRRVLRGRRFSREISVKVDIMREVL